MVNAELLRKLDESTALGVIAQDAANTIRFLIQRVHDLRDIKMNAPAEQMALPAITEDRASEYETAIRHMANELDEHKKAVIQLSDDLNTLKAQYEESNHNLLRALEERDQSRESLKNLVSNPKEVTAEIDKTEFEREENEGEHPGEPAS